MARSFPGTLGSNAHVSSAANDITGLNNASQSMMAWVYNTGTTVSERLLPAFESNGSTNARRLTLEPPAANGYQFGYSLQASTVWRFVTDDVTGSVWHSVVVAHNRANTSTTNPTLWVDAVQANVTKTAGNGTPNSADNVLRVGSVNDTSRLSATVGCVAVVNSIVTDADANRFHWWGAAPGGPSTMLVWLPLWTTDVANKGAGGAFTFTENGTSMAAMPKVERCWASSMGCGR